MYSLDQNLPNGDHYYSTNTVALTCAPGGCAVNDPPLSLNFVPNISSVPEPSTWAMLLIGFAGISFMAYHRKSKPALMADTITV
jgi:PEP-CTERM motif